jgi:hypothetical protein
LLGPTSRAGTLQPDAGLSPHPAAWPENLKETKHISYKIFQDKSKGRIFTTDKMSRLEEMGD